MMLSSLDHLMAVGLVVAFPLYGSWSQRVLVRATAEGRPDARMRDYLLTMLTLWSLVLLTLLLWGSANRPGSLLGLVFSGGTGALVGAGATVLALLLLLSQWHVINRLDDAGRAQLAAQMGSVSTLLPQTSREYRTFQALSVTAGICEEVLYRGFLLWYAAVFFGVWPAVILTGLVFGLAHLYQGAAGVVKSTAVGLLLGALYATTESLLWPILIHIAIDLQGGAIGWALSGARREAV
ncbi:CPBP family intramembrane metalloprotease [Archangium violaceum]|uniref:CPBP family intramembrane glutamic endopeptidase n=1 Tax=Archangium violaceum TaxID=83451 RepID=UPI00193C25BE|nr:CPBP family intramembrane glutamic endopeptidase [Archangium violaceum]QRK04314.1 CPBP family intramembrane metalloprotease [Archangium violaceum]